MIQDIIIEKNQHWTLKCHKIDQIATPSIFSVTINRTNYV